MTSIAQASTATLPATDQCPTLDQVLDLPLSELLTLTGCELDTIDFTDERYADIDTTGFLGYVVIRDTGRATIYTAHDATPEARDVQARALTAWRYGLPTPDLDGTVTFTELTTGTTSEATKA